MDLNTSVIKTCLLFNSIGLAYVYSGIGATHTVMELQMQDPCIGAIPTDGQVEEPAVQVLRGVQFSGVGGWSI